MNLQYPLGILALATAAAITPAGAATIYDTMKDGFQCCMAWDVNAGFIPGAEFTSPGNFSVTQINVALIYNSGPMARPSVSWLPAPAVRPERPWALGAYRVNPPGEMVPDHGQRYRRVDLLAGHNYFLQISPGDATTSDAWSFSNDTTGAPLYNGETLAYASATPPPTR